MAIRIPVLVHSKCEHIHKIEQSIETVHRLQSQFHFSRITAAWLPHDADEEDEVDPDDVRKELRKRFNENPVIAIIQNPFETAYFSHEYRGATIISLADWESIFAPPTLQVYLAYQFAGSMLNFAVDLSDEMIDEWAHNKPIGCIFDDFRNKEMIKLGMVGANLCGECEVRFAGMGLTDAAREAVEQVLGHVRSAIIRRPRAIPSRVFIGHGRAPDWMELYNFLASELGLPVDEFNQEVVAGIATTDRLQQMLHRACFALIVMTAEDEFGDKRRARQNVIHEIGLFQGRLGFKKAIILKERASTGFSNVDGLTYIAFAKGKLRKAFPEIQGTLEREGVLLPTTTDRPTTTTGARRSTGKKKTTRRESHV